MTNHMATEFYVTQMIDPCDAPRHIGIVEIQIINECSLSSLHQKLYHGTYTFIPQGFNALGFQSTESIQVFSLLVFTSLHPG